MKTALRTLIIGSFLAIATACTSNNNDKLPTNIVNNPKSAQNNNKEHAEITFDKTEHDFGRLLQGEMVSYTFKYTNTGNAPLVISSVNKSCGCTASEFTKEPTQPGGSGVIKVTYDSKGHEGFQTKTVSVMTNTNPTLTLLKIKAEVVKPDKF